MALKPVTVSQLNEYISRVLTTDPLLGNISVRGEISNLKHHSSGHVYFSLVDENSKINCFLPASYARNIGAELSDGLEITIYGYINVYKKGGAYTLFVRTLEALGAGDLANAFELLKQRLEKEGLFDKAHKKPLPAFPRRVGVVTSPTGAAVRDIITIITSRTRMTDVIVFPVQVQGEGAAEDIAATLAMINRDFDDIDVLIVGRGGGSAEDLSAFNEENVARAVYNSRIPVISAVGHETDFSICDFVSDLRAETPTAAAEAAVPDDAQLRARLAELEARLSTQLTGKLEYSSLLMQSRRQKMSQALKSRLSELAHETERAYLTLKENNPFNILAKGYALIREENGRTVTSVHNLKAQPYRIMLRDGTALVSIAEVRLQNEKEGDLS